MIGSKPGAEAADTSEDVVVEERPMGVEAVPGGMVDRMGARMRT